MAEKAGQRWLRLCYGRIPNQVGAFFERLTLEITSGTEHGSGEIDLFAPGVDAGIEVKGSDDTHALRIPTDQLERHAALASGFPCSHVLYFIYRYRNRQRDGRTGLSRARGASNRARYLLANTQDLAVVDHRIFQALRNIGGKRRSGAFPMDPERECLIISRRGLDDLFESGQNRFSKLTGLSTDGWQAAERSLILTANDGIDAIRTLVRIRTLLPTDTDLTRVLTTKKRLALPFSKFLD